MASKLYSAIIAATTPLVPSKMMPLWNHAAGPKTVFFWAPVFKWGLVMAGLNDLRRPADQLSIGQSCSLAATGIIWSRYSLVIIPKNYGLFSVNVFVALTQVTQLYRAFTFKKEVVEPIAAAAPESEKKSATTVALAVPAKK